MTLLVVVAALVVAFALVCPAADAVGADLRLDSAGKARRADLHAKYGPGGMADLVFHGQVRVGMSCEMVADALGRPITVQRSTDAPGPPVEVWTFAPGVGRRTPTAVRFEDGKLAQWSTRP